MLVPTITDRDEWNYLNVLKDDQPIGFPHTADKGYYSRILRYKYPQCHHALTLTSSLCQVLQPGISPVPFSLTPEQQARQELFDELDLDLNGEAVTKKEWLKLLRDENLLPL